MLGAAVIPSSVNAKSLEYLCTYVYRCHLAGEYFAAWIRADWDIGPVESAFVVITGGLFLAIIAARIQYALGIGVHIVNGPEPKTQASAAPKPAPLPVAPVPAPSALAESDPQKDQGFAKWITNGVGPAPETQIVPMPEAYEHYLDYCAALSPPCPPHEKKEFASRLAEFMLEFCGTKPVRGKQGPPMCPGIELASPRPRQTSTQKTQNAPSVERAKRLGFASWLAYAVDEETDPSVSVEASQAWEHYCEFCRRSNPSFPAYPLNIFGEQMKLHQGARGDSYKNATMRYRSLKLKSFENLANAGS